MHFAQPDSGDKKQDGRNQGNFVAKRALWQSFQKRNRQKNKSHAKTGIHSAVDQNGRKVSKPNEIGVQQRNTVSHVIEQKIVFCIEVKDRYRNVTKQENKGNGLIFQDTHHKKRKAENKNQGWQTDDQVIT